MSSNADSSGYSQVETYPNGNFRSFIPLVETEWRLGADDVKLCADHKVQFYENGNIKSFTLFEDVKIQCHGVRVKAQGGTFMEFFEDGRIKQITVGAQDNGFFRSKNWTYRDRIFEPGARIIFSPQGLVL